MKGPDEGPGRPVRQVARLPPALPVAAARAVLGAGGFHDPAGGPDR